MIKYLVAALTVIVAWPAPVLCDGDDASGVLADIVVKGNRSLSRQAVLHHVRSRVGQRYDAHVVNADEQRLLKTGRFQSVRTYAATGDRGVVLTFEVVEHATIERVEFVNNKAIKTNVLRKALPYDVGDPLSPFTVEASRKALLQKYHKAGHQFAEVKADIRDRQVIFEIVEGPKVTVRSVRFEGNTHFESLKLRQTIGTSSALWPVVKNALDLEQLDRDVQGLRQLYVDEGFLGAEVQKRLEYNDDKSEVVVVFVIEQHQRYRIREIRFEGNAAIGDDQLTNRIELEPGNFVVASRMRQDVQRVQGSYGQVGYIEAFVESDILYVDPNEPIPNWIAAHEDPKPALVILVFRITEEDKYIVGRVDIRGNTVTQERVVRRQLRLFPEQVFDTVAVQRARRRLLESELFDEVTITPLPGTGNVRDILVELKEANTGDIRLGVGVSSNSGLLGSISYTERNFDILNWPGSGRPGRAFKGAGQRFSIVAEPGTELMRFHVEWFEPSVGDQPYSMGVKAFLFERGRDSYDEFRAGPVVSVGHRFKNQWYGEIAARVEMIDINNLSSSAPPEVTKDEGSHVIVGAKATLIKDRTDSRWMPTTGDRIHTSYEQVLGDFNFGRLEGDYRIYRTVHMDPLDRKHVLAGRAMIGQIFGSAPVFEEFYAGGIGSMRGFEYRGISPRSKGTDKRIGGDFILLISTEYGFPVYGKTLRGVVFLDTGTVESTIGLSDFRAALGAGLRWIIPALGQIPISLDFAVPVVKDGNDDEQVISFFIGWAF